MVKNRPGISYVPVRRVLTGSGADSLSFDGDSATESGGVTPLAVRIAGGNAARPATVLMNQSR